MLNLFKNWILKRKFVTDHYVEIFREASMDAFAKAREDLEETNVYDTETKAKELADKMLQELLTVIDQRKIIAIDKTKGIIFIGGEKAEDTRLSNLKQEAEFIVQSDLWQLLSEAPKQHAQMSMFINGESIEDMRKGRSMLYTLSVQKNIIDILRSYVPKK